MTRPGVTQRPDGAYRGFRRSTDVAPYGEAMDKVRARLLSHGIVEQRAYSDEPDAPSISAVQNALKRAVAKGDAVKIFRGTYVRPDVAAAITAALVACGVKAAP